MPALKDSLIILAIACLPLGALAASRHEPAIVPVPESGQLKGIIDNLRHDNDGFVKSHNAAYFKPLIAGQTPRATVVTCSDSRVHTQALDKTPDGDLFMIRNIGNQLVTAEGSVEYGVHHLHTPLLIFIGHSFCGAIKAASGNYGNEPKAIKRELGSIKIAKGVNSMDGVRTNVNNQVTAAMKKFRREVKQGELTVIGAVYDFANELGHGYGKLDIVNLNGDTNRARINASSLLNGVDMAAKPMPGKAAAMDGETPKPPATVQSGPAAYSYP